MCWMGRLLAYLLLLCCEAHIQCALLAVGLAAVTVLCALLCCAGDRMQFARRVGLDLFRFLEGFATQGAGDTILIPTNILDRWAARYCCCALTPCDGVTAPQHQPWSAHGRKLLMSMLTEAAACMFALLRVSCWCWRLLCRWLQRFERLFRLDPDFLTRQEEKF
jgi:hypothetical protein